MKPNLTAMNRKKKQGLSKNQERALIALLSRGSITSAAEESGLNAATIHRYLAEPEFKKQYREARRQAVEGAIATLQQISTAAAATLGRNLTCGDASPEIRAAQVILELAIRGVELVDLQERIDRLQEMVEAQQPGSLKRWG